MAFSETFKVAMPLVSSFNPISNEISSANYVGFHLYYPLFGLDANGNTESEFLDLSKTKSLSLKFDDYRLCLKEGLKFSDGTKIQSADLVASLNYLTELSPHMIEASKIVNESQLCVELKLKRPVPNLFKKLTGIASTVLKSSDVKKTYPTGLGAYKIKQQLSERLILVSQGDLSPRFNEIEFRKIKSKADLSGVYVHDFNQMPNTKDFLPSDSKVNLYSVPSLKVYSLVINLPNANERQCARQSLRSGEWKIVYGLSVISQNSFLPWRTPQTARPSGELRCSQPKNKIPFLVVDLYDSKLVSKELSRIGADQKFEVVSLPSADFVKWVFSGKQYVTLMGFDSTSSTASLDGDFSYYFESFFMKENRIVTNPVPKLEEIIKQATRFDISPKEREAKTMDAEKLLLDDGCLLPIGRLDRKINFPSNIQIEEWADKLNGLPKIWKIK